jgi:type VI secretion system secreted protein Hcp
MAVDMFLKLDGVTGEAQDSAHKEEIDVLSWSWGMSQSGTTHMGGGGGAGKVSVQDISLTKYLDKSSPTLQKFCANGKHVATGCLTVRKAGENPLEYLKVELEEIIISSVSTGGSGGEDRLTENISLNFKKFHTTYTPQMADGTADAAVEAKWNIAENKEE